MVTGEVPSAAAARALEQYLILTIDHGFNASTFTARVVASTGADLADVVGAALGALAGPLHGGAPSRALDVLDAIGDPDRTETWVDTEVAAGRRIMGFGHAVYRTVDPRSVLLREIAVGTGGPLVDQAVEVERRIVDALARLKPGRPLPSNVEFFAGVVMAAAGLPRWDVHADVRRQPDGRMDDPRRRAGGAGQADPPQRPLRRLTCFTSGFWSPLRPESGRKRVSSGVRRSWPCPGRRRRTSSPGRTSCPRSAGRGSRWS